MLQGNKMPAVSSIEGRFGYGIPVSGSAPSPRVWSSSLDGDGSVAAGNGTAVSYYLTGPNDSSGTGWTVVRSYFSSATSFTLYWDWTTSDGISYDWPFYTINSTLPSTYSYPAKLASQNTQAGTTSISISAGNWFSVGCFSADSCCGRGFCTFSGLPAV
jgi:hypothetical protein